MEKALIALVNADTIFNKDIVFSTITGKPFRNADILHLYLSGYII